MNPILILVATAALGIEVGWEPLPEGGHEYTIELEPQVLDLLGRGGDEIVGEVPPEVNVRRYRIFVGTEKLARVNGQSRQVARPATPEPSAEESGGNRFERPPSEEELAPQPDMPEPQYESEESGTASPIPPHASDEQSTAPAAPAPLPDVAGESKPVQAASFSKPSAAQPSEPQSSSEALVKLLEDRPWAALLVAAALLCFSLAANLYLGWIAWDARSRYRATLARVRLPVA